MNLLAELLEPEVRYLAGRVSALPQDSLWVQLPCACWQAAGGNPAAGEIVALAFLTGTLGLKILDDVQDEHAPPTRSNEGVTLVFQVLEILARLPGATYESIAQIQRHYTRTLLKMAAGQQLDLSAEPHVGDPLAQSWYIAARKTGAWFAWGASLYPQSTGDENAREALAQFGLHLGLMHQLANDFRGFLDSSDQGDLKAGKLTIPAAFLKTVCSDEKKESTRGLGTLLQDARTDTRARRRLVDLASESGLERYVRVMSAHHAEQACRVVQYHYPALLSLVEHPSVALHRARGRR